MSKMAKLIIAAATIGATTFVAAPASAESGPSPLPDSAEAYLSQFHLYEKGWRHRVQGAGAPSSPVPERRIFT